MAHFPFQRLQAELAALIESSPGGARLPSEPDLSKQLGVSRATLREAMRSFETQGLIRRRQGSGTYVVGVVPVIASGLEVFESIDTMVQRMNLKVTVSGMRMEKISADKALAEELGVPMGAPLTRIRRVMHADGRPVAYLSDTLPETVLRLEDLPDQFTGSVLDFMVGRGDSISVAQVNLTAIGATAEVAKAIEIQRGDVLLYFNSKVFDDAGKVIDRTHSYFIPGYFHFHIVRRVVGNG